MLHKPLDSIGFLKDQDPLLAAELLLHHFRQLRILILQKSDGIQWFMQHGSRPSFCTKYCRVSG